MEFATGVFGILGVSCGLYCLYGWYMMKKTGEINTTLLGGKAMDIFKCRDKEAYLKEVLPKILLLGIVITIYGVLDLIDSYVSKVGVILPVAIAAGTLTIIWCGYSLSKAYKKYFE